ncbi:MAG: hypothetical protein U0U70_14445 [Chitinophagaceae bacterium]
MSSGFCGSQFGAGSSVSTSDIEAGYGSFHFKPIDRCADILILISATFIE